MKSSLSGLVRSTTLLCAGAIITLTLLSLGIEPSHAARDPALSEPLLKQGTLRPEDEDGLFHYWNRRKKYFLVVAVNQTDVPKTELPFAQVDGYRIVQALTALGYQPLDQTYPILTGKDATATRIMARLEEAQKKEEKATIIVYYTGHGAAGSKDLWLQTAGQEKVGNGQGLKVSDLIVQVRQTPTGKGFEGELVLIIDACYSGQGTLSKALTLDDMGRQTTIFTSSTDIQESFSLNPPDVPKQMSAFTHTLLQGLEPNWVEADSDGDGMLRWEELKLYAVKQLRHFKKQGVLPKPMRPSLLSNYSEGFLTYQRDRVRVWDSSYRTHFTTEETNEIFGAHLQRLGANPKDRPALPEDAQRLAQQIHPAPDDYYVQAVKATAEGQLKTARALFAKAESQSQERATQAAAKQRETEKQGQIYVARARMESYAGQFTEAFSWYQRAAKLSPPTIPEPLNEMGVAGLRAGRYPEAEPYLTQALKQREQDLAPDHPLVATSLNNLALLYHAQGKYAEADPLFQQALHINEQTLGTDHPHVATSLNNLALLYAAQGKHAEAEPLYQRVIAIDETALGPEHPHLATSLNNLAELYRVQGKYTEAEPLYQRALSISEKALGPIHPDVARYLNNQALLYAAQGKYAEAEPLYQRVITIVETTLGAKHPHVATSLNNLAELYRVQGKYTEAEPLYQRALSISEKALGPTHPDVATYLNNQAHLYYAQGMSAEADPLVQRSFWILHKSLGPEHPSVRQVFSNYQAFLKAIGEPHAENDAWGKLRSSIYAPPGMTHSP